MPKKAQRLPVESGAGQAEIKGAPSNQHSIELQVGQVLPAFWGQTYFLEPSASSRALY